MTLRNQQRKEETQLELEDAGKIVAAQNRKEMATEVNEVVTTFSSYE